MLFKATSKILSQPHRCSVSLMPQIFEGCLLHVEVIKKFKEVLRKSRRSDKDLRRMCQGRVGKLWRKKLDSVKDMSKV